MWHRGLEELSFILAAVRSFSYLSKLLCADIQCLLDQLSVTGGGSASPATVKFPGAYSASDPGILVNIHQSVSGYTAPGPSVYAGGSIKSAGSPCSGAAATGTVKTGVTTAPAATPTAKSPTTLSTATASGGACVAAKYAQCGGTGWTGCTTCAVSAFPRPCDADRIKMLIVNAEWLDMLSRLSAILYAMCLVGLDGCSDLVYHSCRHLWILATILI